MIRDPILICRGKKPCHPRAFTLVEVLVIIAVVAVLVVLATLALSSRTTAQEKGRRANCMNNLRQLCTASQVYAQDNGDRFFYGARDNGDFYTMCFSDKMFTALSNLVNDKVIDCPNVAPFTIPKIVDTPGGRHQKGIGYYIGYNYMGGMNFPPNAGWTSPHKTTDGPKLVLFSDANDWGDSGNYRWVMAPHRSTGAATQRGNVYIYPSKPLNSAQVGALGGNVAYVDGSVVWKPISQMKVYWTFNFDGGHRGYW